MSAEEMNVRDLVMKHVVLNALKYGKANEKAVLGKIMAENPHLRSKAREVLDIVRDCVAEFEKMGEGERKQLIEMYSQFKIEKKEKKELKLPELPKAERGKVKMRFAPNPNGPPTLGSARGIIVNGEYAKMYDGEFVVRFDDTDPRTKRPMIEAYEWYLEDIRWLGYEPDKIVYASRRIDVYYDYARKLIEMGKAYVCFCSRDEFKGYRDAGKECPHRNASIEDTLSAWEGMLDGRYGEGEAVLRVKTDMSHPDPAIRDWVAFRIINESHPLVGDRYSVYPTLDFESAIEDRLCGITHIIRGKDLIDSERRQRYIYEYFGWEYPVTKHWGRVKILEFGKLSTSALRRDIEAGKYEGWDDPRLPTIRAFRRRGFEADAIKRFFLSLGVGENDVSISLKNLYAENRKIVDAKANRRFFVWDPVEITIEGLLEDVEVELPLNPSTGSKRVLKGMSRVYVTRDDFERLRGQEVRLKEFCNVVLDRKSVFVSFDVKGAKKGRNIIHWLPFDGVMKCRVIGEKPATGLAEKGVESDVGNVVQFERFAFCRVERVADEVVCIYTHP